MTKTETTLKTPIPATRALELVLEGATPLGAECISLHKASGRVLAADLAAKRTQPPFDASAMDGYAVCSADIATIPVRLKIAGTSRAGEPFDGKIKNGTAIRIFTGAVVPAGADTIIIQENTTTKNGNVSILENSPVGRFIRPTGLDFNKGDILLAKGDTLTPARLAITASMNHANVNVYRKPVVAILATGDELVPPGSRVAEGQIIASNAFGLSALVKNIGGKVIDLGIAADTHQDLSNSLKQALDADADLIVTIGGASVGDHDLVLPVACALGFKFEITKILMRPGKPFLFARYKNGKRLVRLIGLAGNPVSSLIAADVFVRPLVNRLAGFSDTQVTPVPAILGCDLPQNDEREEYLRASLSIAGDGQKIATPFSSQDSAMLALFTRADCLVIRQANAAASSKGDPCRIRLLR